MTTLSFLKKGLEKGQPSLQSGQYGHIYIYGYVCACVQGYLLLILPLQM